MHPFAAAMFGPGVGHSAFDPATLGSNTTLSNANRTATHDASPTTPRGVRGALGRSVGKFYFEMAVNPAGIDGQYGITQSVYAGTGLIGTAPTDWGYNLANGTLRNNNTGVLTGLDTLVGAGVACFAVDLTANKLWVRVVGGNWNGNASYDPAAGTGGQTIASATWYPAGSEADAGIYTLNVGQEAFSGVRPSGFYIWE